MNNNRWVILSLLLSLALNLLLCGVIIGSSVYKKPIIKPLPPNLGWMIQHLDSASLNSLQPQLEAHTRRVAPIRREMRQQQKEFNRLLLQPKPDNEVLAQTLSKLREHSDEYQQEMHSMILKLIPKLNEDQRRQVNKLLRKPPKGSLRHGDR